MKNKAAWFTFFLFFISYTAVLKAQTSYQLLKKASKLESTNKDSAIICYNTILFQLKHDLHTDTVGKCYNELAIIYEEKSKLQEACDYGLKALACGENNNDTAMIRSASTSLAITFNEQRKYKDALFYDLKAMELARLKKDYYNQMISLANTADVYGAMNKKDSSIRMLQKAIDLANTYNYPEELPFIYENLGNIYFTMGLDKEDKTWFQKSLQYARLAITTLQTLKHPEKVKGDFKKDMAYAHGLEGASLAELQNYIEAEIAYDKAISFYTEQKDLYDLSYLYYEVTRVYINAGKKEKALQSIERYDSITKAFYSKENTRAVTEMQAKYDTEKKEQLNKSLQKENLLSAKNIKQQQLIIYFVIGSLAVTIALAFFIFRGLKQQRKAYKIISMQKKEVEHQKELVEEKQKEILDSITYARRIQKALITSEGYIERNINKLKKG